MASLLIRANQRLLTGRQLVSLAKLNQVAASSTDANQTEPTTTALPATKSAPRLPAQKQDLRDLEEFHKSDRGSLYPDQMEWLDERQVRISKPSKNVMQSGTANTNTWKIEFDSRERWQYWLMGWTSSNDPMSNLTMNFPTKEDAIAFCDKNKLQWYVEEQPDRKLRKKSYADNFAYKRRTRLGNK